MFSVYGQLMIDRPWPWPFLNGWALRGSALTVDNDTTRQDNGPSDGRHHLPVQRWSVCPFPRCVHAPPISLFGIRPPDTTAFKPAIVGFILIDQIEPFSHHRFHSHGPLDRHRTFLYSVPTQNLHDGVGVTSVLCSLTKRTYFVVAWHF